MNIWEKLVNDNLKIKFKDKIKKNEQNNISTEAITDVLNDNPEEVPDDVGAEDENAAPEGGMDDFGGGDFGDDMGGGEAGGDNTGGFDDTGSMDGGDSTDIDPNKIKKNEFSNINNKIYIIERYNRLLDTAVKAQEIFKKIPEIRDQMGNELAQLIEMIEDEKESVALYSKAENNIRYRLYFEKVNRFIGKILKFNK